MSITPLVHSPAVLYPSHNTRVSEPEPKYYTTESYALSGKIMLSAIIILFVVVVLIVSLHIYARWFITRSRRRNHLRRRRRRRNHLVVFTTDISPSAAAMRGLDPSVLKSLPTFTYSPMTSTNTNTTCPIQECAVCLSEFEENEKGRILPKCNHSFHIECIDMWFQSHSTCPLCRAPVTGLEPVKAEPPVQIVIDSVGVGSSGAAEMGSASSSNLMEDSKKRFMGSIEVPPRRNESFKGLEEEVGFKSPGGRIRYLKRMLSRDFRRPSTPSPRSCSTSSVATEIDLERGGEVEEHSVTPPTPPPPPAQQTT